MATSMYTYLIFLFVRPTRYRDWASARLVFIISRIWDSRSYWPVLMANFKWMEERKKYSQWIHIVRLVVMWPVFMWNETISVSTCQTMNEKKKTRAHTRSFEWNQCIMVSECEHAPSFKNEFLQQFAAKSTTHKQSTSAHRWVSIIYRILRGARFRIQFSQHFYHPPLNGIHSILP